jgi:O-methyltransferase involved in polyketide biosynthesis
MEENQVNLGALAAAYYRACHAIHDDPKIFYDCLANRLITDVERVFLERLFMQLFESIDPAGAVSCLEQTTAPARSMRA